MKTGPTIPIKPSSSEMAEMRPGRPVVVLRGVTFGYEPGRAVLDDISAELLPGRVTAVLGPNASGKSTLVKTMLGQVEPWRGEVEVHGRPVAALRGPALARQVSYIPQRGSVSFAFSVRQVVAMGRFAFGDEQFVDEALDKTGLTDLADRVFAELSGGQQQRVLIARAWAQSRPPDNEFRNALDAVPPMPGAGVVLADEPASSLDLRQAHSALGLLRELAEEGRAVLVVLHELALAERWADEVWLMDRGHIVARGDRGAVLRPKVLEPVYGVSLGMAEMDGRRVFVVRDALEPAALRGPGGGGAGTLS